ISALVVACSGSSGDPAPPANDDVVGAPGAPPVGSDTPPAALPPPAFDPLERCASLDAKGANVAWTRVVLTARVTTPEPLLYASAADGTRFGVREGEAGVEIVRRGADGVDQVVASAEATPKAAGEWMLRLLVDDGAVRAKAWPAATHEPYAWQASW